jgi:hypothetical protein
MFATYGAAFLPGRKREVKSLRGRPGKGKESERGKRLIQRFDQDIGMLAAED